MWGSIDLHLRQSESVLHAASAIVARAVPAWLPFAEIPRPASALRYHVHAHTDQSGSIGVHHVRQIADIEGVRAAALAHLVLVVALVNADHGDIDTHIFLDLSIATC